MPAASDPCAFLLISITPQRALISLSPFESVCLVSLCPAVAQFQLRCGSGHLGRPEAKSQSRADCVWRSIPVSTPLTHLKGRPLIPFITDHRSREEQKPSTSEAPPTLIRLVVLRTAPITGSVRGGDSWFHTSTVPYFQLFHSTTRLSATQDALFRASQCQGRLEVQVLKTGTGLITSMTCCQKLQNHFLPI